MERILARAQPQALSTLTPEAWLCAAFGVEGQAIAPVTLMADGMQPGSYYWLRADPAHVQMQREQLVLQPDVCLNASEAEQLCTALNEHFADEGLHFFAPYPQRWYLRLDTTADMVSYPPGQVAGKNLRAFMPQGTDALRWHQVFNEIQMLLFDHPVNLARESQGELPINSVWLWGGGSAIEKLSRPFSRLIGDSSLAEAFAQVSGICHNLFPLDVGQFAADHADALIVWDGLHRALQQGDLHAWRDSVQHLEQDCAMPLWQALCDGRVSQITLDTMTANKAKRLVVKRNATWMFWRMPKSLASHALV